MKSSLRRDRLGPRQLAQTFAELVAPTADAASGPLVGVEHEYQVLVGGAARLDFGSLVHTLGLGQPHLDPGDLNAYRLPCGIAITADDAEAEIVSPPVRLAPGFAAEIAGLTSHGRHELTARLPTGVVLRGFSTQISVEVPNAVVTRVARSYPFTFGPAMMLLLDNPFSPGLLVRPRPGRLELGGDFADGQRLRAALVFAVASVIALHHATEREQPLPVPTLAASIDPDDHRFGWFISRRAYGDDLYTHGRETMLTTTTGEGIRAHDYLRTCWNHARQHVITTVGYDDVQVVDDIVYGQRPLPCDETNTDAGTNGLAAPRSSNFGDVIGPCRRRDFSVAPVMATWSATILVAVSARRDRRAFMVVPRANTGEYLTQLDRGELDEVLNAFLSRRMRYRTLRRRDQALRPGLWDRLGTRTKLVHRERRPARHP